MNGSGSATSAESWYVPCELVSTCSLHRRPSNAHLKYRSLEIVHDTQPKLDAKGVERRVGKLIVGIEQRFEAPVQLSTSLSTESVREHTLSSPQRVADSARHRDRHHQ